MTAKQARRLLFVLATVLLCVAVAQQQAKPNRTVSYFTKNDPKYGEVISALGDEPKCATVDVNVHDDSASWLPSGGRSTKIDPTHETWWLTASPKEYSGYKKYRYNYMLEPPGTDAEGYGRGCFRQNSTRLSGARLLASDRNVARCANTCEVITTAAKNGDHWKRYSA